MRSKTTIISLVFSIFLLACSKDDTDNPAITKDGQCTVAEISFATSKYEYKYNTAGNYLINEYYGDHLTSYYVQNVSNDSLLIGALLEDLSHDTPLIATKTENERFTQIKRFYASAANLFNFEYSASAVRITQQYISGNDVQTIAYGDYTFDTNGNVTLMQIYRPESYGSSNFVLSEEKHMTYDSNYNPWQGIIFPTFRCQDLPSYKFLSRNNALSETRSGTTITFQYDYDAQQMTIAGYNQYPYAMCNKINQLTETYIYSSNCNE